MIIAAMIRDHRQRQRDPGAVQDPGEHVPAELVGAEPVCRRRRGQDAELLRQRVLRRDERCEDRDHGPGGDSLIRGSMTP
jgi:hypothetical protein